MRRRQIAWLVIALAGGAACARPVAPATPAPPRVADLPGLEIPAGIEATPEVAARHNDGWRRFQAGDLRGATREYSAALSLKPDFFPSQTGMGYIAFQDEKWQDAARWFDAAIAQAPTYIPALSGRVETSLSLKDDLAAIRTLELWLKVEPAGAGRDDLRGRLDVLRLRAVQAELTAAATAREAGRLDDAQASLDRARAMSPESAVVLRELARVEGARGAFDAAESHARAAVKLDPGDAEAYAVLGDILDAHGRLRDAAAAFARAVAIDPRPAWRERVTTLNSRAAFDDLPAEYRAIPSTQAITRGQLAALFGMRLESAIDRAPRRVTVVLTDVRTHWAAQWILPITRAGLMDPMPNHTFQPGTVVRRSDLAQIVWRAIQVLGAHRTTDVARWRAARPTLADVPRTHLASAAIASAVASGAMSATDDGRFQPSRAATGAEAVAALARLEQIVGGGRQ
jgi:tetratricopeptide (TPR) repeat protein